MGMEALETAVAYWEDALESYTAYKEASSSSSSSAGKSSTKNNKVKALTTREESRLETIKGFFELGLKYFFLVRFTHLMESLLEEAYRVQEQSESLFIYQNSVLNKTAQVGRSRKSCVKTFKNCRHFCAKSGAAPPPLPEGFRGSGGAPRRCISGTDVSILYNWYNLLRGSWQGSKFIHKQLDRKGSSAFFSESLHDRKSTVLA